MISCQFKIGLQDRKVESHGTTSRSNFKGLNLRCSLEKKDCVQAFSRKGIFFIQGLEKQYLGKWKILGRLQYLYTLSMCKLQFYAFSHKIQRSYWPSEKISYETTYEKLLTNAQKIPLVVLIIQSKLHCYQKYSCGYSQKGQTITVAIYAYS